jgi:hypothetical protein
MDGLFNQDKEVILETKTRHLGYDRTSWGGHFATQIPRADLRKSGALLFRLP